MRNLRKLTAAVLAVAIVLTTMTAAFAATDATAPVNNDKAIVLNQLGLYAGTSTTEFVPDLGAKLTRQQATVMLLKMFGLADKAAALKDEEVATALKAYTDADKVASWAKKSIAYAVSNNIMSGVSATTIDPAANVTGAQYATLIVKSMGYKVDDFKLAVTQLSKVTGSKVADEFADADLTRDGAVGYMFGALTAETADKTTVIANLVAENPAIKDAAVKAGLVADDAAAKALDVDYAVALNSKIVEVALKTAATAADVTAATFTVKDSASKEFKVASAVIAPWSEKSVMLTLEADTTAGTLYTVTTGDKAYNFGGKAVDTTKATATVASTDYNEATITFSEAIKLETAKVTITKKYGDKAALATTAVKYDGSNKLVFATADQADATLYGVTIEGVSDLAGNVESKIETTFVGQAKSTADQEVVSAKALDYKTIYVDFKVKVDPATIVAANFALVEMYGTKATIAIEDAKVPTIAQAGKFDTSLSNDDAKKAKAKSGVVITLTGEVKDATLYKVTAKNVMTLYGKALSSTEAKTYATFTGKSKPASDSVTYTAASTSNTEVTLTFANDVEKTSGETLANYTIVKLYGDKAALAVTKAVVDGNKVKLTVNPMSIDMYKVTALNIKDIYGNSINTSSDKNIQNFAGQAIAGKIDGITVADTTGSNGKVRVTFNKNYGAGALDVSSYTFDQSIGYPSKVEAVSDDSATSSVNEANVCVDLTIPKTEIGVVYKLTVKNVKNSDGVAMDTAGVSKTFVGTGEVAGAAKLEAVYALDSKTIKLYFNKNVEDISGLDSKSSAGNLAAEIAITNAKVTNPTIGYAYVDPSDKKVIIAYASTGDFKDGTNDTYTATVANAGLNTDYKAINFAENTSDAAKITVSGIVAKDQKTIEVYFNQPIRFLEVGTNNGSSTDAFGYVETASGTTTYTEGTDSEFIGARAATDDKTVWELSLDKAMTANTTYYLVLNAYDNTKISNIATGVTLNVLDTTLSFSFAGNGTESLYVKDVYATGVDKRTIKVYYPEAMNEADVETTTNYTVVDGASTPADVGSSKIVYADYDSATKIVTLTTNADFATSTTGYYLAINNTVRNAIGTKTVKTDASTNLKTQVALGTADAAELLIKSVSVSGQNITVEFNQQFKTATDVVVTTAPAIELVKYLEIKVNGSTTALTSAQISSVVAKTIADATAANTNGTTFVDTLVITVVPALTLNGQGSVELINTATATGINGIVQDTDADAFVFAQK